MLRRTLLTIAFIAAASPAWAGSTSTSDADATAKSTAKATSSSALSAVIGVTTGGATINGTNVPSIGFSAAGLAGLPDGGGCVLAKTKSIQAGITIAGFGGQGAYADGETNPYYECNAKQTLAIYSAMEPGSIVCRHVNPSSDCHTAQEIAGRIASHLTGVDEAFDELDGTKPGQQTGSTSATPAAILPQQTADASAKPRCANDAISTASKMALGCQ